MSDVERFYMAEWSEDSGFGAMDHFVYARDYDAAQSELAALREELAVERGRLNYLQDNWVSVSCRVANTGFCGPRGREWECYVYAAGPRNPKSAEGETLREAIDAMRTLNKPTESGASE